jgi:hypothetical protein
MTLSDNKPTQFNATSHVAGKGMSWRLLRGKLHETYAGFFLVRFSLWL